MIAYRLTDKGRAIGPVLLTLLKWGDGFYPAREGPPRLTIHTGCGGNVDGSFTCERCGERPPLHAIELRPGPGLPAQPAFESAAAAV